MALEVLEKKVIQLDLNGNFIRSSKVSMPLRENLATTERTLQGVVKV